MHMSRRAFGQWLLSMIALPRMRLDWQEQNPRIPETIAGHTLTREEQDLASTYHATHEKHMGPLRERDLPNDLPPDFRFVATSMNAEEDRR